jgi:hypothetical protein
LGWLRVGGKWSVGRVRVRVRLRDRVGVGGWGDQVVAASSTRLAPSRKEGGLTMAFLPIYST